MKVNIDIKEKNVVTTTKEFELPYFVKSNGINQVVAIIEKEKAISVVAEKQLCAINVTESAFNFHEYFNPRHYLPATKGEFLDVMEEAIKGLGKELADVIGIETSLLP